MTTERRGEKKKERERIRRSGHGTSVFMMEMIIVVFFFCLCVSVCILLFVKADTMSRLAADTNQAVTKAECIGEIFKAGELENYRNYPETEKGAVLEEDLYRFVWDKSWKPAESAGEEENQAYYGEVKVSREEKGAGTEETARIKITGKRDSRVLYELTVSSYRGF